MPTTIDAAAAGSWTLGDLPVHRMGFGTMRLTADPDRDRAIRVLRRAVELGVNHLDTAAFYRSPGGVLGVETGPVRHAAELIHAALGPYAKDLVIVTKVIGTGLRAQVEENLRLLGLERLDVVNLRVGRRTETVGERFAELAALRDEGLIAHLGLSNVTVGHLDEAQAIAPVVCVQNSYSLDYRRAEHDDVVRVCRERGIAFVPFFTLAGAEREKGAGAEQSAAVQAVAQAHAATPAQVRLAWTLHRGPHILAIPGTGSVEHLTENVGAGALRLSAAELTSLG
jgi:aryl-alcohol dehydrogenase-like predicted oxidoreductase